MIILKATNSSLLAGAKFSYLTVNYVSGVTTLVITNGIGFAINDYLLLGEFGQETSEIVKASNVVTNTLTVGATKFAHPESTKVTIIPYNQVKFYHTTVPSYTGPVQLDAPGNTDIQADDLYTKFTDSVNDTGYGWFCFYNSTTTTASAISNAIPYTDFAENSAKKIIDSFFSMLNNKEVNLVSQTDALRWLNEGYSRAKNELNLINNAYNVAAMVTLHTIPNQTEYDFVTDLGITDFSDLMSITDTQGIPIEGIPISDALNYRFDTWAVSVTKYYLRGTKIGLIPTPTYAFDFYLYYKARSTPITSLYTTLEFPDNNYYFILDYMMYRACPKLGRSGAEAQQYITQYTAGISLMKVTSIKQTADGDHWEIAKEANK
jgi:hypothetical protein